MSVLTINQLSRCFSANVDEVTQSCQSILDFQNLSYKVCENGDRDAEIIAALKFLEQDKQKIGELKRTKTWEDGWYENLKLFEKNKDEKSLCPKFLWSCDMSTQPILRLFQEFIKPDRNYFELNFVKMLQSWLFRKYFHSCDRIVEFGCGSGFNIYKLCEMFPDKTIIGCDFSWSSVELINLISKTCKFKCSGRYFNMKQPDQSFDLQEFYKRTNVLRYERTGILTFGAIEQLASDFHSFIVYLLNQKPTVCVHIEPTIELYDEDSLIDCLSIKFHRQRGYTEGLLPHLQLLEKIGKIEILQTNRTYFGNSRMEGYSIIAWRPSSEV